MTGMSTIRPPSGSIRLFLAGDVMTGRGIDQVLPNPSDPEIHESHVKNARTYVELAERVSGPIARPVEFSYIWGDALEELARMRPDARIVNLETSITRSNDDWPGKGINYRMHPQNVPCITAAGIDCCVLANNHVADYGYGGLLETIETLSRAGIGSAGAGRNLAEAQAPAAIDIPGKGRVVVFASGTESSGIPRAWAAVERPGVNLLDDLSDHTLEQIRADVRRVKRPRDVIVGSIHWGENWGFDVPEEHVRFAHGLVRAGVDLVHGHSAHHVLPIEVFDGKLILYGCGDFLDDYEGIGRYQDFRSDLVLMYFPTVDVTTGGLVDLQMTPMEIRRFSTRRAPSEGIRWLRDTINRESRRFHTEVSVNEDGRLELWHA
ncbi:MAG TPA: CapA family protein [Candidatus Methylomirabilis sp.]|nr:CapA family protein [Candidatus Methylomirabilis sp.]